MCCACPYVCINLHTFVSIKNECLIVTNFTLVNLNLSSVTCSGVSHIWTEKRKKFDETANYADHSLQ